MDPRFYNCSAMKIMKRCYICYRGETFPVTPDDYQRIRIQVKQREDIASSQPPPYQAVYMPAQLFDETSFVFSPRTFTRGHDTPTQSDIRTTTGSNPPTLNVVDSEVQALQKRVADRDPAIDTRVIETYFSDNGFQEAFGITKQTYLSLPTWRREILRRDRRLF